MNTLTLYSSNLYVYYNNIQPTPPNPLKYHVTSQYIIYCNTRFLFLYMTISLEENNYIIQYVMGNDSPPLSTDQHAASRPCPPLSFHTDQHAPSCPWLYGSPPLASIFGIPVLYCTCIPPVSRRILGIPLYPCVDLYLNFLRSGSTYPACISPYPWYPAVSLCRSISNLFAQRIHGILLYPTVSSCIRTYLAVSSCICCIPLYLTHCTPRLKKGIY